MYMPVGVAALDDLGVAGDDLDAGRPAAAAIASTSARSTSASSPSSRISDRLSASGPGAGHRQVVDGAVDRQLADRAAGEAERLDHEAVGRHREPGAVDPHRAGVGERVERAEPNAGTSRPSISVCGRLAAGAVGHRDALVAEPRPLGAGGLDDPEDPLLAIRECAALSRSTPRSRANRP